ncbi:MAG: heme NO-binding domain-containing protein [Sphingomonas sp.]|nr:heme NO-binding domain-containing protein [Sphingomonas sp.]
MKGLVFTTFFAHCEQRFGADLLDDIIEDADLPNKGAYTSVGTYPFDEMIALTTALVRRTGQPLAKLLEDFGCFCFGKWVTYVPAAFENRNLFDILAGIDSFHELEVRKLYPDAELPSFTVEERDEQRLLLRYVSCKPLADLAAGVIKGAAAHLGECVEVSHWPHKKGTEAHVLLEVRRTA